MNNSNPTKKWLDDPDYFEKIIDEVLQDEFVERSTLHNYHINQIKKKIKYYKNLPEYKHNKNFKEYIDSIENDDSI